MSATSIQRKYVPSGKYNPWWLHDDEGRKAESCNAVFSELHRIEELEAYRRTCDQAFVRWYGDPRYNGFSTVGVSYPSPNNFDENQSTENAIREILTTQYNKFKKNKPVPTVITIGGTWKDQEEAQEREQWIRGVFEEDRVYDLLAQAQFNSMVFCDGFIGVRDDWAKGRPVAYQIPPFEIHVDPVESQDGLPRSIYRVSTISKEVLIGRYPDFEEEILRATPFFEELWNIRLWGPDSNTINFLEAWHLPSSEGAGDGRHILALPNLTLVNEPWDHSYFPLVKLPWSPRPFGYFSVGLIEDLIGPQRQLNKVSNAIDEHLRLLSSAFWAVQRGSQLIKSSISNLIGRVLEYTTKPPELMAPDPISPALVQQQEAKRNQIFAQSGVSQMSTQAMKPAGLNSGKALRVYADQEDIRFVGAYEAKERAVVDLANLYSKRAQAMLEADGDKDAKLTVRLSKDSQLREIEWKDADLDSFRVQVLPASALSTTLAGRIEDVEDLESLGLIQDQDQKRQLLQIPDLKADSDLSLAPRNLILKTLQTRILKDGESITPEPYWPPDVCATLGLQVLCQAELQERPADRIDLLRLWVNECVTRAQAAAAPPPAPPTQPSIPPGLPSPAGPSAGLPLPSGPTPGAPP